MENRNRTPLVITLFAVLAVLYPALGNRTPQTHPGLSAKALRAKSATAQGETAKQEFPGAKDLVAEFLFSRPDEAANPSGQAANQAYGIEFLIATVPDPIDSRLPNFFDSFAESIGSAAEAAGYALDRFVLPWKEESGKSQSEAPLDRQLLAESHPGLILFRNPHSNMLLLVFLIGETPTTGIHKQALFSALDQMAQFYPWDPRHAELPPRFPKVQPADLLDTLRLMGPAFSGSAISLRFLLDSWLESRNLPNLRFRIISGTATAIDPDWISHAGHGQATFQATVPPDIETLQTVACYIQRLGYPRIAILTEGNTAYGQNLAREFTATGKVGRKVRTGEKESAPPKMVCRDTPEVPQILNLPFPLHISSLREQAAQKTGTEEQASSGTESSKPATTAAEPEETVQPREVLPSFSDLTVQSARLTLSNLLSTIARERYSYVGIVATDVRDVTFLAREVRWHSPATVLFTLNSDLLYAYPEVNHYTLGMLVITPYPLFNLEQLWTYPYRGGKTRLQFSSQAAEGVYNATLALLDQEGKMVDYGRPLETLEGSVPPTVHKPSLWVTAIGNGETLPISLLRWEDPKGYTYGPAGAELTSDRQAEDIAKPVIDRGLYSENAVVVVIALGLLLCTFSVLIISQYQRFRKVEGSNRISALLGDPASPAYWSEGRLFLLCCCASLLTFYIVVVGDFCLPLMAGRVLGSGVPTSLTPKVAVSLSLVTVLLLLLATHSLVAAFGAAPAGQRGSAAEVTLFALLGCALAFVLSGFLVISWYQTVVQYPASGLFSFLRSFDLGGGLSPLVPLACVAAAACLWSVCSFRRLRTLDVLRASGTGDGSESWLNFLSLEGCSFYGVRELENNIKRYLESSSVFSLKGYTGLLAVALLLGHYFFNTRLVRALEARPFYWVFETAFFIVYWALLMEFMRLVFTWRSLHQLLQRLSWHPLHAAFKRYHDCFPSLAKMNLTSPPSSFAALESSVEQAAHLLRTTRSLILSEDTDPALRDALGKSISGWETQVLAAENELCEALRLQWTDPLQDESESGLEPVRQKHARRLGGDWRESLACRSRAHRHLFEFMQSLTTTIEPHWFSHRAEGAPAKAAKFFEQAEEFIVSRIVNFLAVVFPSLQNLGYFVLVGLLLMLLAVTSYPFQPRNEFLFFNWIVILSFIGTAFWIFMQMDRDTVLSLLNGAKPGQVHINREFVLRIFLYIGAPLLALFGAQFPESLGKIISVFTAAQGAP